jgi:membrane protease YdiL (CAAX protease family)
LGIGRGVLLSSLCFGVVHGINVLGGAPVGQTLIQVTFTCILGTLFLLAAMGTRSLLLPILLHAVWDSAAFLNIYLQTLGASANAVSVLASALGVLGVVQTFRVVRRWTRGDIYPVQGLPQR